ncbi:MAG: DUF2752 domain-containing protein [Thermoanaerobaculales bacterium]
MLRWRDALREEKQLAWLWGVAAASSLLLRPFWLALAPLAPACPFRAITGIPCPTCGTTHAAVALLHGDLTAALAANPLASLAGLAFAVGGLLAPLWAVLKLQVPELPSPFPLWARFGLLATLAANWAWVVARG